MPEQSRQLLDESPPRISPSHRPGTPSNDARSKRKLDAVANAASLPSKRKRKVPEKEITLPKPPQVVAVSSIPLRPFEGRHLQSINSPNLKQVQNVQLLVMETRTLRVHPRPTCHTISYPPPPHTLACLVTKHISSRK
jgi:paired amphipathic helix protein Sin3a